MELQLVSTLAFWSFYSHYIYVMKGTRVSPYCKWRIPGYSCCAQTVHYLLYYYCADLMLSMHIQLLPQGGDLSVFLIDLLFNNVLHLHRLLSGSTFAVKVFSVLLQLMWVENERREKSHSLQLLCTSLVPEARRLTWKMAWWHLTTFLYVLSQQPWC